MLVGIGSKCRSERIQGTVVVKEGTMEKDDEDERGRGELCESINEPDKLKESLEGGMLKE